MTTSGLHGVDLVAELPHAELALVALPVAVEPEEIDLAELGAELFDLLAVELEVVLPPFLAFLALAGIGEGVELVVGVVPVPLWSDGGVVWMGPVELGEVEADFQVVPPQGFGIGGDEVFACWSLLDNAQVVGLGVPEGDAVVVLGGQDGVLGAGFFKQLRPFLRIIFCCR